MILTSAAALLGFTAQVQAHDLWVVGENKDVLTADIVYGHGFPAPEAIQKERTVLFEPIKVVGNGYEEVLKQKGENYHYEGKNWLKAHTLFWPNTSLLPGLRRKTASGR